MKAKVRLTSPIWKRRRGHSHWRLQLLYGSRLPSGVAHCRCAMEDRPELRLRFRRNHLRGSFRVLHFAKNQSFTQDIAAQRHFGSASPDFLVYWDYRLSSRDAPATVTAALAGQLAQSGEATEKHVSTATPMSGRGSTSATLNAYFVFSIVTWGLVPASPSMPSTSGMLSTIFLLAGMATAWRQRPLSAVKLAVRRDDSLNMRPATSVCSWNPTGSIVATGRLLNC